MSRWPRKPGPGLRLPPSGRDVSLGAGYEARVRDLPAPGSVKDPPAQMNQQMPWGQLITPDVDWVYREVIVRASSILATATQFEILTEVVPKSQTFVLLQWVPLLFVVDPSDPGLFVEENRYKWAGRVYSELSVSGSSPLRAQAEVRSLEGGTNAASGATTTAVHGTSVMNQRAFGDDPNFPMSLYIGSTSTLSINFKLFATDGTGVQVQNMSGGGTTLAYGARLTGFYIDNHTLEAIRWSRR